MSRITKESKAEAKRLFLIYTGGKGTIDSLYGPAKATCRAHILSALEDKRVSQRKATWGVFRDAMIELFGIADQDDNLRRAALSWDRERKTVYLCYDEGEDDYFAIFHDSSTLVLEGCKTADKAEAQFREEYPDFIVEWV